MRDGVIRRLTIVRAFWAAVGAVAGGVWRYGYLQALDQLARQGASDLALASDRLTGQLQRYRELAVLVADHPQIGGQSPNHVSKGQRHKRSDGGNLPGGRSDFCGGSLVKRAEQLLLCQSQPRIRIELVGFLH